MKLALYQGPSPKGNVEEAFTRIADKLSAASAAGSGMLVFPELFLPGYNQPALHHSMAQPQGGPWEQRLSELAREAGCGITVGWAEREGETVYNAASTHDANGVKLAHYRKIQLFGEMENRVFAPGDSYTMFDFNGRKTALMICYDIEFAQHCWAMKQLGAELVLVPTANPVPFTHVSDVIVPARALENELTIAYANLCGPEGDLHYCGASVISGPDARPLAKAGTDETLLIADLSAVEAIDPALLSTQHKDYRKAG